MQLALAILTLVLSEIAAIRSLAVAIGADDTGNGKRKLVLADALPVEYL